VLTVTLAVILLSISAVVALLCLLRLRRLHRRRRHDDVKYVDGYGCSRDLSCFRFPDGEAGGRAADRDSTELKKLPVNVDGDVACKEYQVCSIFVIADMLKIVLKFIFECINTMVYSRPVCKKRTWFNWWSTAK